MRRTKTIAGLAGAFAAVSIAAAGCGRGGGPEATLPAVTPAAATTNASASTPEPTLAAASPSPTFDPGTALDDIDAELSDILPILGGVDGSVEGADPAANGGE